MKAIRVHAYGHSDQLHADDVAAPSQQADEVLVRIRAAGVNPVDWKIREGFMANVAPRALPFTSGQDFAGEVLAVGANVKRIAAGQEVYGFVNGSYAELAIAAPDAIAAKPARLDVAAAAALPTPGLTALQAVRFIAPQRGQRILIHGAAGAVGSIATQLCVAAGAQVFATAAGRDAEYLNRLGVARAIDYKAERFDAIARDLDGVIDVVGGDTLARSLPLVKRGGAVVTTVGPLDDAAVARGGLRATRMAMQRSADDLRELAELVDRGALQPRSVRVMPLASAREAQERSQAGAGEKVVLMQT